MRLTIASRKSDLARIQAYMVGAALKEKKPSLEIKYSFSASLGDKNQDDPLWKMPTIGVFTKDFRDELIQNNIDMVVHSWKDLPIENDGLTMLAATLPRADHRDLLLVKKNAISKIKNNKKLCLLSSSPRRAFNLEGFLKKAFPSGLNEVIFDDVRGNIQTRLDKMLNSNADGLIVAKAAIDRLLTAEKWSQPNDSFKQSALKIKQAIEKCEFMVLPASANPPAAAQGALAIEINSKRKDLVDILKSINCQKTFDDVKKEREILGSHGGGCHQKIGVWVKSINPQEGMKGRVIFLRGQTEAGENLKQISMSHVQKIPSNISKTQIFHPSDYGEIFLRKAIAPNANDLQKIANADILLLASSHIPNEYLKAIDSQIVWTSGVKSWFKFAAKNIWVNGTDDNLGAFSNRSVKTLLNKTPNWLTLTHKDSPSSPAIATYQLSPNSTEFNIKNTEYFYWRSSSSFKRALELEPKIIDKHHSCGLGQSYEIIKKILEDNLGKKANILPFINEEDWLSQISD